jgi:hypothetical protein
MPMLNAQQTFGIEPDSTLVIYPPANEYSYHLISFPNLTNDTLTMQWRLAQDSMVEGWDYFLCDLGECYSEMPQNETMEPATGDEIPYLEITMNPNNIFGEGKLVFYVNDVKQTQVKQRVEFFFIVGSSSTELLPSETLSVFPNPCSDLLTINAESGQIEKLIVFNLSGEKYIDVSYPEKQIDVSAWPVGQYIIKTVIGDKSYSKKISIIH